ncbi:MAG TPA: TMEM43 family protein [Alphaproteobacteria bacterium]|jgi:hypothetical protein|nr:TMEM43 family protein [Alphaproteobacteria bacterium]
MSGDFSGNSYTEVTTQGWLSRIGGSLVGMLFGFLLVPISVVLLYWNEGRAVEAIRSLDQGAKQTIEAGATPSAGNNGKLVHLTGALTTSAAARDPAFHVTAPNLIRLHRQVEMYQWKQETSSTTHESVGGSKTTETTYNYHKTWSEEEIDSADFKKPSGHRNPQMPAKSGTFDGRNVKLGEYRLDPEVLSGLDQFKPVSVADADAPEDFKVNGNNLYSGRDPAEPEIGDIRVSFSGVAAQTASVVAGQNGDTLSPFTGQNGYTISLVKPGVASAAELFQAKKAEEGSLTWILRLVGFVMMLVGFLLIASPVSTVLAVVPLFEWVAEAGFFVAALGLSIPLTLIVIAVAWIIHRPLTGILLLAVAGGAIYLVRGMRAKRAVPARA